MWRMRDDKLQDADDHGQALDLVRLFDFEGQRGLTKVHWHTLEGCGDQLMTLDEYALRQFTLQNSTLSRVQFEYKVEGLTAGAWNPHHSHSAIAAVYRDVLALDMRAQTPLTTRLAGAHEGLVRDVDYNPNKPYHIATAGDDRKICIWDLRRPSGPLCSMTTQSHWVWAVKFNRFHDQLLLSAGSNSSVSLWSAFSVSSAPLGDMEDAQNEKDGDSLVKTYEEHEDSVYTVAWSPCDAWIFASLSYDGRVVVNHVPPTEKYKILL
jgi:WD40 repeat protein